MRLHVTEMKSHPGMKKFLFTSEFHPGMKRVEFHHGMKRVEFHHGMKRVEFHPGMKFNLKNLPLSMKTCNKTYHFNLTITFLEK